MDALSERQSKAVDMIAHGKLDGDVARKLGVTPRLIRRWRQTNPRFQRSLAGALSGDIDYLIDKAFLKAFKKYAKSGEEAGGGDRGAPSGAKRIDEEGNDDD